MFCFQIFQLIYKTSPKQYQLITFNVPKLYSPNSFCYLRTIWNHIQWKSGKVPHSALKSHQHTACIWKLVPVFSPPLSKGKTGSRYFPALGIPGEERKLERKNSHVRSERAALFDSWGERTKRSEIMNWIKWEKVERWKKPNKGRAEKTTAAQKERWKHSRPDQTGSILASPKQL